MSSEYQWYLPERIIYAKLSDNITVEDLYKGSEAISRYLFESRAPTVHLIFDARDMTGIAFTAVSAWRILSYLRHPRLRWIVMFGTKGIMVGTVQLIVSVISAAIKFRYHACDTLEEALTFLREQDDSLPDLSLQDE